MALNEDTKRRVESVCRMIQTDRMNKGDFLNLIQKSRGKDAELVTILTRANAKAVEKYEDFKGTVALSDGKFNVLHIHEKDNWIAQNYLNKAKAEIHNDKEFANNFLTPEIRKTAIQRDKELKRILKEFTKKERAIAIGLGVESVKKRLGLSR